MAAGREKRREDLLRHLGRDAGAAVDHLHDGIAVRGFPSHGNGDLGRFARLAAIGQRVLHQNGQHLVQVLRVHQGEYAGAGIGRIEDVRFQRMAFDVVPNEVLCKRHQFQAFGLRSFLPGQAQDVLDDAVHSRALAEDDLQQAPVGVLQIWRLFQQLRRIADGSERVTHLVGDAGRQAAQGKQRQLLRATRVDARVVQEDQEQFVGKAERDEAGQHFGAAFEEGHRLGCLELAVAPVPQRLLQIGRYLKQVLALVGGASQQRPGRFIRQADAVRPVHHQHAGAHAPDHQFVQFAQVGQVFAALAGQRLAGAHLAAQLLAEQGSAEVGDGEHGRLGGGARLAVRHDPVEHVFTQQD